MLICIVWYMYIVASQSELITGISTFKDAELHVPAKDLIETIAG